MTLENKIKFAVIGCGHIGKRHAEMVIRNPESELVALIDVRCIRKVQNFFIILNR